MKTIAATPSEVKWGKFPTCQTPPPQSAAPSRNGHLLGVKPSRRNRFPATHSEKNQTAVLRVDQAAASPCLSIDYRGQTTVMELACGGKTLCSGPWEWEVIHDGQAMPPVAAWESTCWVSDADVDYLELEIKLADGWRVERHIVLARKDRFLLLADAVRGPAIVNGIRHRAPSADGRCAKPCSAHGVCRLPSLRYRSILPLAPGVCFRGAKESREGFLAARKRLALVLPLALPEWRCDQRVGELAASSQGLELHHAAEGRALFAPLFLDLDPRRLGRRLTWRQLTVAESLEIQSADVAAGYRVAVGTRQWLIYRSLACKGNRTLLGHNLSTETLVARFQRKGEIEPIIEIE